MKVKHTLNMAQVYAFGYQQRHPEWTKSPWTECDELCQRDFGDPRPTLTLMLRRNPRATLQHFAWNVHLVPAGLQVLMFDCTSRRDNPDYAPVTVDPPTAGRLSLAAASVLLLGFLLLAFRWRYWWNYWLRDRAWGWAAMFCVGATIFLIVPTQRPPAVLPVQLERPDHNLGRDVSFCHNPYFVEPAGGSPCSLQARTWPGRARAGTGSHADRRNTLLLCRQGLG